MIILLLPILLFGSNIKDAEQYFAKKEYKKAHEKFLEVANDGMVAKYNIGYMYELGLGVKKDTKKALTFYAMSANDGFDVAQNSLGNAYLKGIGVKKNIEVAIYYYQKAAKQNNKDAIKALAELQKPKKTVNPNTAYLTVRSNKHDDRLYLDGKYVGSTKITLALEPKRVYTMELRKKGWRTYRFEKVIMKPKEKRTIKAYLSKE